MIFYKLLEISTNSVKIEFCPSFFIGQYVQIIALEDLGNFGNAKLKKETDNFKNNKKLPIFGKITEINSEFATIQTFKTLENLEIENLAVQTLSNNKILSFSPTVLGRFWSNFVFLETIWQEEEKAGKLLGSRLLTGKIIEYNQDSPNWQNSTNENDQKEKTWQNSQSIRSVGYHKSQRIQLNLNFTNPIFEQTFNFPFEVKLGNFNYFSPKNYGQDYTNQNSEQNLNSISYNNFSNNNPKSPKINFKSDFNSSVLQLINQIKSNFDQPIFLILTSNLSILQLKDFYFKLLESENLFNCFVTDLRFLNKIIVEEIGELAVFLNQNLEKKVFIISEFDIEFENQFGNELIQHKNQTKIKNWSEKSLENPNITFIQIGI